MSDEATTLADSSVSDMVVLMKDADLATLKRALEIENSKPQPRKGAVAALESAIEGHPELAASAAAAAEGETHDTEHDQGLSAADARVPGDAVPVAAATAILQDEKQPLGSLPDTATATKTVTQPLTIDTNLSDRGDDASTPPALGDAVIPTKPGGADLEDVLDDATKDVLSRAPNRASEGLVNQLDLKWAEMKHFVATITGDVEGELGEVLAFVRAKL